MKKQIAAVCGALAIAGLPATAQTPQAPTATRTTAGAPLTVIGCVMSADAAGSNKAAADSKYVLSNVQHAADAANSAAGASKRGASASSDPEQTFALEAKGTTIDFSKHLNHKVELTGRLDTSAQRAPQVSSTGTSGSTGTATPGRDAATLRMPAATLEVTALKMVSATCP